MSSHILLTGAAGFIGSNLAPYLLERGFKIVGIDNLNPVYSPAKKQKNIATVQSAAQKLGLSQHFQFIKADICDAAAIEALFKQHPFSGVIHLAALAGVQPSIADPLSYQEVNIRGTMNLLEACKNHNVKKFVGASSSSVYGGNTKIPFSESDPVNLPISPYAATKRAGELLSYTYHHLFKMSIACLRFFTVYGPNQRPDLAIYKFTQAMLQNKPITLYGDGTSLRDYTYITDIIHGIERAYQYVANGTHYDIFNLGENDMTSLNTLVELLEKNLGVTAIRKYAPYLPGDVVATNADISHSKRVLGYAPKTKIPEGLRLFCEWFRQNELSAS